MENLRFTVQIPKHQIQDIWAQYDTGEKQEYPWYNWLHTSTAWVSQVSHSSAQLEVNSQGTIVWLSTAPDNPLKPNQLQLNSGIARDSTNSGESTTGCL